MILLPGPRLNLSALLAAKKFRGRGNKEAALAAMRTLEDDGLGRLESQRAVEALQQYVYHMLLEIIFNFQDRCTRTSSIQQ